MTRPSDLVAAIADAFGLPEATVTLHGRNLREAGLRAKGPQGRSAGNMSHIDATNILIAVAGSRNVKDSAATVLGYATLWSRQPVFEASVASGVKGQTFAEAICELLKSVPENKDEYRDPEIGAIKVSLFGPRPRAEIEWTWRGRTGIRTYLPRDDSSANLRYTDLQYAATFTQITLGEVGTLLRS